MEPTLPPLKQSVETTGQTVLSSLDTVKSQVDGARGQLDSTIGRAQASADTITNQVDTVQTKVEGAQTKIEDAQAKATAVTDQAKGGLAAADTQVGNIQGKADEKLQVVHSRVDDTKSQIVSMRTQVQDSLTSG